MLIDWFTVGAQALNFIILVWLMKRFLYRPILNAIDAREKRIAAELADANQKQIAAQKQQAQFQQQSQEFEQQRAGLLRKATDDAGAEAQRLLENARKAADNLSARRLEQLRTEADNLEQSIRRRTQEEVFAIARKALTDLATADLEERITAVLIRRLDTLDGKAKQSLGQGLNKAGAEPVLVRSAFALPQAQREALQQALSKTFSVEVRARFETAPELVAGIELLAAGYKVSWSIAEYLGAIERSVDELLKDKAVPVSAEPK
jgi:F-type H+-transporting ATPase subunit b